MNVTIDMMKRVNAGIASKRHVMIRDLIDGCGLDSSALEAAVESLDAPITAMAQFFDALSKYLEELDKRMKMMSECYKAIQKLQIDNDMIKVTAETPDPAIVWRG